jgi:hypothetical protein
MEPLHNTQHQNWNLFNHWAIFTSHVGTDSNSREKNLPKVANKIGHRKRRKGAMTMFFKHLTCQNLPGLCVFFTSYEICSIWSFCQLKAICPEDTSDLQSYAERAYFVDRYKASRPQLTGRAKRL